MCALRMVRCLPLGLWVVGMAGYRSRDVGDDGVAKVCLE